MGQPAAKFVVAGGEYNTSLYIDRYPNLHIELCGNVTLNSFIYINGGSNVFIYNEEDGDYTLTVHNTNESRIAFCITSNSYLYCSVKVISIQECSKNDALVIRYNSFGWFAKDITLYGNGGSGFAIHIQQNSYAIVVGHLTIDKIAGSTTGFASSAFQLNVGSVLYSTGGITEKDDSIEGYGLLVQNGSQAYFSGSNSSYTFKSKGTVYYCGFITYNSICSFSSCKNVTFYTSSTNSNPSSCALSVSGNSMCIISLSNSGLTTIESATTKGNLVTASENSFLWFYSTGGYCLKGTVTKGAFFASDTSTILLSSGINFNPTGYASNVSGPKYYVERGSQINVQGAGANVIPGSGQTVQTSQYAYYG